MKIIFNHQDELHALSLSRLSRKVNMCRTSPLNDKVLRGSIETFIARSEPARIALLRGVGERRCRLLKTHQNTKNERLSAFGIQEQTDLVDV